MGVGVSGDSTGTQAPAEQSGRLFCRGGRQDVLWERGGRRRAGSSVGLLMVAIFVSPS